MFRALCSLSDELRSDYIYMNNTFVFLFVYSEKANIPTKLFTRLMKMEILRILHEDVHTPALQTAELFVCV